MTSVGGDVKGRSCCGRYNCVPSTRWRPSYHLVQSCHIPGSIPNRTESGDIKKYLYTHVHVLTVCKWLWFSDNLTILPWQNLHIEILEFFFKLKSALTDIDMAMPDVVFSVGNIYYFFYCFTLTSLYFRNASSKWGRLEFLLLFMQSVGDTIAV